VGIRPEHVALGAGPLRGTVELIEPTGLGTIAHLSLGGTALKSFALERSALSIGAAVNLDLPLSQLHLFDANDRRVPD